MKDYEHFFLPSGDLKESMEFYQALLGLPVKFDYSNIGMMVLKVGESETTLVLKELKRFPQAKPAIWLLVEDVQEEYKRLSAKGVKFLSEPFPYETGFAVEFEDPFGNRLGLTDYSRRPK
jgi:predicted enzyme related to lactoylglutathione lyase